MFLIVKEPLVLMYGYGHNAKEKSRRNAAKYKILVF
jgi:hypothetical protein